MIPRLATLSLAAALAVPFGAAARADDPPAPEKTSARRNPELVEAFVGLARTVCRSVATVGSARTKEKLGYGVAIEDGTLLLTSRSIVDGEGEDFVIGGNGRQGEAKLLAKNEAYDVALLRLRSDIGLAPLPLGRSRALAIGAWVVSVGTDARPLAVGVVSALDRRVEPHVEAHAVDLFGLMSENAGPTRAYARVIQHDSPLDATRQGGAPLVDKEGRLVGINVASAYRGSTYAAPIDDVKGFLEDMKAGKPGPGLPPPGFIGVALGPIARKDLAKARAQDGPGAEVKTVIGGSPAEGAGLRAGDAILEIDGERIRDAERVGQIIREKAPGTVVRLKILRGGEERDVRVTVGARPKD